MYCKNIRFNIINNQSMLTHHHSVSLTFISTNLPILSEIETIATIYEKENNRCHFILNEADLLISPKDITEKSQEKNSIGNASKNLLWLEISPYRVIMTKQSDNGLNYRYFWEQGVYGINRYWLNELSSEENQSFRLRNFTRKLTVKGNPIPHSLRIEYELWSDRLNLGHYVLHLEIK